MEGQTTENAQVCHVELWAKGAKRTPPFHRVERTVTFAAQGGTANILQVDWSKAKVLAYSGSLPWSDYDFFINSASTSTLLKRPAPKNHIPSLLDFNGNTASGIFMHSAMLHQNSFL